MPPLPSGFTTRYDPMLRPISSSSGSTADRSRPSSGQWRISSSYWVWHSGQVRDTIALHAKPSHRNADRPEKVLPGGGSLRPTPPQLTLPEAVLSSAQKRSRIAGLRAPERPYG